MDSIKSVCTKSFHLMIYYSEFNDSHCTICMRERVYAKMCVGVSVCVCALLFVASQLVRLGRQFS